MLERAGYACQDCGCPQSEIERLEVHHKDYDYWKRERPKDLEVLCKPCHERADARREAHTEQKHWDRRVDGYATKRWGGDWSAYIDPMEAAEELKAWIQESQW
jgi:5-methylcytosine-specific restriction endonuclease McrA